MSAIFNLVNYLKETTVKNLGLFLFQEENYNRQVQSELVEKFDLDNECASCVVRETKIYASERTDWTPEELENLAQLASQRGYFLYNISESLNVATLTSDTNVWPAVTIHVPLKYIEGKKYRERRNAYGG